MKLIARRLHKLENRFGSSTKPRSRFLLVLSRIGYQETLEDATCIRTIWPDGTLFEFVRLKGAIVGRNELSDGELDGWLQCFPIR